MLVVWGMTLYNVNTMTKAIDKCVYRNFDQHWVLDQATGCHLWTGAVSKGYGRLRVGKRSCKAYRYAYELAHGPIPPGQHVLHRCNNGLCCNVAHLYLGTHTQNMRDRVASGERWRCGDRHPNAKLTYAIAEQIRSRVAAGMLQREAGAPFGASQSEVSDIVLGKRWRQPC